MSAYIIADVNIAGAEKMARYREWSSKAMQEHGARPQRGFCDYARNDSIP